MQQVASVAEANLQRLPVRVTATVSNKGNGGIRMEFKRVFNV